MPPRQASRCCRAVHQRIASPADGVWITETALANAFERYCHVSKSRRRMASNVPGPLENRRRLGKRQMTELGIQAHPSLPIWALPNAPDLSRWKWLPPTDSSLRSQSQQRQRAQPVSFPSLTLPSWLTELAGTAENSPAVTDAADTVAHDTEASLTTGSRSSRPFFERLEAVGQAAPSAGADQFASQFREVCKELQQQLALAALRTEEVDTAVRSLLDALAVRFSKTGSVGGDTQYLELYSAVVSGITSCKILHPRDFSPAFWGRLLLQMATVPPSEEHRELFGKIMKAIPGDYIVQLTEPITQNLSTLVAWKAGSEYNQDVPAVEPLPFERRAAGIAGSLESLNVKEHALILETTTNLLLRQALSSSPSDLQNQTMYHWMTTLAQMQQVDQDHLFAALQKTYGNRETAYSLRNIELCELLVRQWASRSYAGMNMMDSFRTLGNGSDELGLAGLALAIFKSEERRFKIMALYSSLWKCLRVLGRESELTRSLERLVQSRTVPLSFLEILAESSDDVHVAVQIHSIYVHNNKRRAEVQPLWDPSFWDKFAARMNLALDNSLTLDQALHALDMSSYTSGRSESATNKKRKQRRVGASTVALVEELAVRSAMAADLENRQALRRVEQCRRFLIEHQCALPLTILKAIYHVITRDLAMAQPGRTSRLRWFLGLIREQYNDQTSLECALAFQRWRTMIRRYLAAAEGETRVGGAKRLD